MHDWLCSLIELQCIVPGLSHPSSVCMDGIRSAMDAGAFAAVRRKGLKAAMLQRYKRSEPRLFRNRAS